MMAYASRCGGVSMFKLLFFWMRYLPVDVVSIEKTGENFRLIFDVKGRFTVHRISDEEARVSCLPVQFLVLEKITDLVP